ncbi:hypothetical protein [Sphingobacterium sp. BIGb0165]|uniref:hypothetical protein n=1 Tax=Sphingobacterium sp. BIGb0165 TaxID=2940615 RepID=UPI002166CD94|nr:hypothetical protein [Sphingobacterium sp. BIGb0165]MCS4229172.1 carbon monoxide dehydrogenase subunit G [Sphingobacterium sp. BIGb0165]
MKRILFMLVLLVSVAMQGKAQMATAAVVSWDIDRRIEVPVARDSVWSLLKNNGLVAVLSNGYVKSMVNKGTELPIAREVTFKDGSKRDELLNQLEEQHRFLVYTIEKDALPTGLKAVQVAIFTKEKGDDSTEINWMVKLDGDSGAKKKYIETLNAEIEQYATGFRNYLTSKPKVIQAVRMQ